VGLLHRDQKLELIKDVPLFATCSKKELGQIAHIADEIDFPEGKELTRQGALGREFFVLLDGTVEVTRDGERVDTMVGGDFFGEMSLLSDEPRNATITTATPVRALVVTARDFRNLVEDSPEVGESVRRAAAWRRPEDA
jgi:CRP-like cAMP-binding protein